MFNIIKSTHDFTWHRVQIAEKLFIEEKLAKAAPNQSRIEFSGSRMMQTPQLQKWQVCLSRCIWTKLDFDTFCIPVINVKKSSCDDPIFPFKNYNYPACKANVRWSYELHPRGTGKVKEAKNSLAQKSQHCPLCKRHERSKLLGDDQICNATNMR